MDIFLSEQRSLGRPKPAERQEQTDRNPDEVHPPGWRDRQVDDDRKHGEDCSDDQDQKGGRTVPDVEAIEV